MDEAPVDTENPDRGPLLLIAGEKDNIVPPAITNGAYNLQRKNSAVTVICEIPDRGHTLIINHGWRDVAEVTLEFIKEQLATESFYSDEKEQ